MHKYFSTKLVFLLTTRICNTYAVLLLLGLLLLCTLLLLAHLGVFAVPASHWSSPLLGSGDPIGSGIVSHSIG